MNRLIMSVNSGVVDLLHSTLEDSPMTEEISLEYMYFRVHVGLSRIFCQSWTCSLNLKT